MSIPTGSARAAPAVEEDSVLKMPEPLKKIPNKRMYLRAAFFPLYFVWAELVLHLFMGKGFSWAFLYIPFALSAGCLITLITLPFPEKVNRAVMIVLSLALPFAYGAEIVTHRILQSYYLVSMIRTAAGNDVFGGYGDLIWYQFKACLPVIIVLFIPAVIFIAGGKRLTKCTRPHRKRAYLYAAALTAGFHLLGFAILSLPVYGTGLTPAVLYRSDTNVEDQVNELGLITSIGLDEIYMVVEPPNEMSSDFSMLGGPDAAGGETAEERTADGEETGGTEEETAPAVRPQVLDADLAGLADSPDEDTAWLASYFLLTAPTETNAYTGMFEGYNVIELVLEGFSGYGIDEELTPTLWRLTHEGFIFTNYYTALHYGSTSGGECQTLLGLYPKNGSPVTMPATGDEGTNVYMTLSQQLSRQGYRTLGFHDNYNMYGRELSHPNLGLEWRYSTHGLAAETYADPESLQWPQFDSYMIAHSTPYYLDPAGLPPELSGRALPGNVTGRTGPGSPFYVYYLTVSGHVTGSTGYDRNRVTDAYTDLVQGSERFAQCRYGTQAYEACAVIEVDRALERLLADLEAAGELDRTLIVATADHIPYSSIEILADLSGREFGGDLTMLDESRIDFDVYRNSLILWTADMDPVTVEKPCCQVDILPTVSNLLGLEYDSRMLAGRDILSDEEGLVIFASRCWLTDRGFYDRFSGTFTPAEGVRMSEEETARYVQDMNALVGYRLDCTQLIMQTDFYEQAFGDRPRAVGRLANLTVEECAAEEEPPQVSETGEEAETETAGPPASEETPSTAGTQRNTETAPGPGADGVPEETMEPEGTWDPENAG